MESPSFLRLRPKMSQRTEKNIEKGIERNNCPKRSEIWCTQKTYTAWQNLTMSMRTMPTKTVLNKFVYIKQLSNQQFCLGGAVVRCANYGCCFVLIFVPPFRHLLPLQWVFISIKIAKLMVNIKSGKKPRTSDQENALSFLVPFCFSTEVLRSSAVRLTLLYILHIQ